MSRRTLLALAALVIGCAIALIRCESSVVFGDGRRVLIEEPDIAYPSPAWRVSYAEAKRADAGVRNYLVTADPDLAASFAEYSAQIFGRIDATGRALVRLNFFCDDHHRTQRMIRWKEPRSWFAARWTYDLVEVNDGGRCYFRLDFDPATGNYEELRTNAQ